MFIQNVPQQRGGQTIAPLIGFFLAPVKQICFRPFIGVTSPHSQLVGGPSCTLLKTNRSPPGRVDIV